MNLKTYLGDGVYAEFDGFAIILTSENGTQILNEIFMEPEIMDALNSFWSKIKERKSSCETIQGNI